MYYVYVIYRKQDKKFYIGYSSDLRRRVAQHNTGQECQLMYYEAYLGKKIARRRELQLKQYGGSWRSLKERIGITKKRAG